MTTPKVNILLSTYNGMRFLEAQLDSLLKQDYPNINLYIRDDGSTDNTFNLLQGYQDKFSHIRLIKGNNIGWKHSFFQLVLTCEDDMDNSLYAFCDQDDVWNSEKISRAVEKIQKSPNPSMTLYFHRVVRVDAKLKLLHLSSIPKYISFGNAVCEPAVLGCSTVFGREIKQMFTKGNPNNMIGHDWWIYLLATAFGHVIYGKEPQILYRIHDGNTSFSRSGFMLFKFKSKEFLEKLTKKKRDFDFLCQAKKFTETYDFISAENKKIIDELYSVKHTGKMLSRLSCAVKNKIFYNTLMEDFFLKLTIIFGCY